jgi:hypothetical protein
MFVPFFLANYMPTKLHLAPSLHDRRASEIAGTTSSSGAGMQFHSNRHFSCGFDRLEIQGPHIGRHFAPLLEVVLCWREGLQHSPEVFQTVSPFPPNVEPEDENMLHDTLANAEMVCQELLV